MPRKTQQQSSRKHDTRVRKFDAWVVENWDHLSTDPSRGTAKLIRLHEMSDVREDTLDKAFNNALWQHENWDDVTRPNW